jgi:hypothetical protein
MAEVLLKPARSRGAIARNAEHNAKIEKTAARAATEATEALVEHMKTRRSLRMNRATYHAAAVPFRESG